MPEKKKTDEEILFPDVKVANTTIRPWSFGVLFEISDLVDQVINKMEAKKIGLDSIISSDGTITFLTIGKLFTIASPEVLKIMSITTGLSDIDIKKLSMEDGIKMAFTIYSQNKETIKNALNSLSK